MKEKELAVILRPGQINPNQGVLALNVTRQIEIDGIGMGVLSDGTPFLSGRGLARLCGISNSVIVDIGNEWHTDKPRVESIKKLIREKGETVAELPYIELSDDQIGNYYVYTDVVSLAILEYYAFDAGANVKDTARRNFRLLAGKALREFIYAQVGYDPSGSLPKVWVHFHERVALTYNKLPAGYFSVFKEIADMIVTLGQAGLEINEKFVPDISVGIGWSNHWIENNLNEKYGKRIKWDHNYPDYFPQAASNPQEAWCYPEVALGEFRSWMRETYIGKGKFYNYINGKVKQGLLPPSFAQLAIAAYEEGISDKITLKAIVDK